MPSSNKEEEKSVVGINPSSAETQAKRNIDILLYHGIGISMTMLLIYQFLPQISGHLYAFILTTYTIYISINKKRRDKK